MKKFFKFVFKLILTCFIIIICLVFVNNETDMLSNPERYAPKLEKSNPQIMESIRGFSAKLSEHTGQLPTIEKIAANIRRYTLGEQDFVTNDYVKNSPLVSFYPKETIGLKINEEYVTVYGNTNDKEKVNFIALFTDENENELSQSSFSADSENEFAKKVNFPETDKKRIQLSIYYCPKVYGEYRSWVLDYIFFERDEAGLWKLEKSPVYESNKALYEQEKTQSEALRNSQNIMSDNKSIAELTNNITASFESAYDKALAVHDWICENIYYDEDSLRGGKYPSYNPGDILNSKKAVCKGYAYLYATMLRSIGIPCNVVSGYALGIDGIDTWSELTDAKTQNHAWNEVYVDGRWIIVDTTWDCGNKIENGKQIREGTSRIYFDANLEYFSANHKIMQYIFK